ncbi:DivIVA domain-containing protein [Dietzia sp. B32]|uniref:DivIVA domain-containing protein n=1 Tax=Dietzia sp. B32 TaxID=2915130 RepID=UPI0021AD8E37|nr:DivIVA domain-containing protein [Dietzia sp. B32]UVE95784.1 DivIVA domain-containing protein [Dietzia sp. B32]
MLTIVVYVVVTLIVAAGLFALSLVVFGRSEVLPPVARGHTVTSLPEGPLSGGDLRAVRFGMSARGYTMAEVDWALEQAAAEIDRLRSLSGEDPAPGDGTGEGASRTGMDGRPATPSGRGRTR